MTNSFSFLVPGEPVGQGSMRHIGNGRMIAANDKKLKAWRSAVVVAIKMEYSHLERIVQFDGPTRLRVQFCIEKPKTVKREYPTTPYDLDKLVRAIGDACTDSGLVTDDAIFVELEASKIYKPGCPFGAHVSLTAL